VIKETDLGWIGNNPPDPTWYDAQGSGVSNATMLNFCSTGDILQSVSATKGH